MFGFLIKVLAQKQDDKIKLNYFEKFESYY